MAQTNLRAAAKLDPVAALATAFEDMAEVAPAVLAAVEG